MDYTGRVSPKGISFLSRRYMNGLGFHELKYRKGKGKLPFSYLEERSKYLEQTKRKEMQFFYCGYVKGVPFSMELRYIKGLTFLSKKSIYKGKGLDLGVEPPRIKLT